MRRDAVDGLSRVLSVRSREGAGGWGGGRGPYLARSRSRVSGIFSEIAPPAVKFRERRRI